MSPLRYITASLWHHRRAHLAVALGVAVATAVFTGALVIGDSLRGSLRDLTLQRLGQIDFALVTPHLFRAELASELTNQPGFDELFDDSTPRPAGHELAAPMLLMQGAVTAQTGDEVKRATNVSIIGASTPFWSMTSRFADAGAMMPDYQLPGDDVWLTESLATELNVKTGDEVVLRLPTAEVLPADSPLGEKAETTLGVRLVVGAIVGPDNFDRFSLQPTQRPPRTAFVDIATLQLALDRTGKANAILVGDAEVARPGSAEAAKWLRESLKPQLADYGLRLERVASDYLQIESDQLVLPEAVVVAAEKAFGGTLQPVATYLANTLRHGERTIPYSTITGVDSTAEVGPILDENGESIKLADDEIALNRWAADDLEANIGDTIDVTYYEPESTHGELREAKPQSLRLAAIVDLATPDGIRTKAADPLLTPRLKGVTDQQSISDWDLPFELVERVRRQDEDYWDDYSTTPKAFVSLELAKRLWQSRWGSVSLLRIPASANLSADAAAEKLLAAIDPESLGFAFQPVKEQGLAASSGTTPFDLLFLGFSMFLIASAVMLIALLFRLGIDARSREIGLLGAIGWPNGKTLRALLAEALIVALIGAAVGVAGGIAYAALMLLGLQTLWLEAIVTPFLKLHVVPLTLIIGSLGGMVAAWLAIRRTLRQVVRQPPRALLAGASLDQPLARQRGRRWSATATALAIVAIACGLWGARQHGEQQAGAFFGSGAMLLAAALAQVYALLKNPARSEERGARSESVTSTSRPSPLTLHPFGLAGLALRNVARNPGRSTLTMGLVAAASFLILAISAFRLAPTEEGTGGYDLIATSATPIYYDLSTDEGQQELGFREADSEAVTDLDVQSLRVYGGEDASCLNLYRPEQPRVLGVPQSMIDRGGFAWADVATGADGQVPANPWTLLNRSPDNDENEKSIVPVILDMNTAIYSLRLYGGIGSRLTIRDEKDQPVTLEVVGLLKNSLLQGDLLIGERDFLRLFPSVGGSQYFLMERGAGVTAKPASGVAELLEDRLSDYGFDVAPAGERLAEFLAVQNTYLSTFQTLGALGLLLGTVGLAVVQLRNMLERREELALMQATGFSPARLGRLVLLENLVLLGGGLAIGALCAAAALLPQTLLQDTSLPLVAIGLLLVVIFTVGLAAGQLATSQILRRPLLATLRGD
ncbi:MAG: ABC transporter permease [Pirellulales bacterium]